MPGEERFRDRAAPVAASAGAAITSAYAGSYLPFGTRGTLIGLAAGAAVSTTAAWYYERWLRRARARAARLRARRAQRADPQAAGTQVLMAIASQKEKEARHVPWPRVLLAAGAALALAAGAVVTVEALAGKPVSAIVHHQQGHGSTFGRQPAPAPPAGPPASSASPPVLPSSSAPPVLPPSSAPSPVVTAALAPSPDASTNAASSPSPGQPAPSSGPP